MRRNMLKNRHRCYTPLLRVEYLSLGHFHCVVLVVLVVVDVTLTCVCVCPLHMRACANFFKKKKTGQCQRTGSFGWTDQSETPTLVPSEGQVFGVEDGELNQLQREEKKVGRRASLRPEC